MTDKRVVFSTTGSIEEARKIAHVLVERKLAACVNVVPKIESVYRWQGKVESAEEWLLLIKTTATQFESVSAAIKQLHSYELAECIAIEISAGSTAYLAWIEESTKQD